MTLTIYGEKQRQPLLKHAKRLLAMYNTSGKNGCPMKPWARVEERRQAKENVLNATRLLHTNG